MASTSSTATAGSSAVDSSSRAHGTDSGPGPQQRTRPGRLLALVLTGQFMGVLDAFIVNVAAPDIRADLHTSGAVLQLIVAGYTIAYAVLLITGARLGGRAGHGRMFLGGLALFTAASLACGLAAGPGQLIAFRVAQGTGAGLMMPQVLSLIQRTFTGTARTRALGAYAAVLGIGAGAGQILGGVLVSADLFGTGWRPVFLINVPVGLVLLAVGRSVLDTRGTDREERPRALDLPGLVLLAAAVLLFTVPVVLGQELGWPLWGWGSLALCAVVFTVFAVHESRLFRRGGSPLLSPLVLRAPGVPLAMFRICAMMAVNAGFTFALMLHLQGGLGQSAFRAGLVMLPQCVTFSVAGMVWRRLPARTLPLLSPGGFLLAAGCFAALGAVFADGGDGGAVVYVLTGLLGVGLSLAFNPVLAGAVAGVRPSEAADASGLLVTTSQLGLLVGVAAYGAVFLGRLEAATGPLAAPRAMALTCAVLAAGAVAGALGGAVRALLGGSGRP
ncbi:MFS transporter [Streptomyces boncukensis]|uniref:MFS transporter n=1 Tax=Streptomyces boncukensis TaxID=2711219 RepID=A0A6G4WTN3_9ACTN|nr:MFS transporter [Streptomyces boncukensis]NGO67904.1 MFS transporter [Streptomyces boncukensis]